jgi:hypothetical protein
MGVAAFVEANEQPVKMKEKWVMVKRKDKFLNHLILLSRVLVEVLALECLIFVNKDIMDPFHSNRYHVEVVVV